MTGHELTVNAITDMLRTVNATEAITPDDANFLVEHKEHLAKVFTNVHIWRTDSQKKSIISDVYHPTVHGKFHQAILEQKVQVDQAFYLAKDFELKKLEIEDLILDLAELKDTPRNEVKRKRINVELKFKKYELKQMQIAMKYRMEEVRGWQKLEEELLEQMKDKTEEYIWTKDAGEIEEQFFKFLTNLQGLKQTTDAGEVRNLMALATHGVKQAKEAGIYDELKCQCNTYQLESLVFLGEITKAEYGSRMNERQN